MSLFNCKDQFRRGSSSKFLFNNANFQHLKIPPQCADEEKKRIASGEQRKTAGGEHEMPLKPFVRFYCALILNGTRVKINRTHCEYIESRLMRQDQKR